jgi:hypothetical protein
VRLIEMDLGDTTDEGVYTWLGVSNLEERRPDWVSVGMYCFYWMGTNYIF